MKTRLVLCIALLAIALGLSSLAPKVVDASVQKKTWTKNAKAVVRADIFAVECIDDQGKVSTFEMDRSHADANFLINLAVGSRFVSERGSTDRNPQGTRWKRYWFHR